jgi:CRP/FNR family transcriptional regulator
MFQGLSPELRARVEGIATLHQVGKGKMLWCAGDEADLLTVVVSGRIKVVRHAVSSDVILEIFGPGEIVGVVAVYRHIPYPASAVAMVPSTLLRMPRVDWFDLLDHDQDFTRGMMLELTRLNMGLSRKLAEAQGSRVGTRIARLLVSLAERNGTSGAEGMFVPIALSRQEIAESVSTTVETAIRTMSRWQREGLVFTPPTGFLIPDIERLRTETGVEET